MLVVEVARAAEVRFVSVHAAGDTASRAAVISDTGSRQAQGCSSGCAALHARMERGRYDHAPVFAHLMNLPFASRHFFGLDGDDAAAGHLMNLPLASRQAAAFADAESMRAAAAARAME